MNDSIKPDSSDLNKSASCQCYSLYLELKRDIDIMKTNQPLDKLKEENSALRAVLLSLKKQCDIVCEEQDSLKLALQIVSKDLYHKNETKPVPRSDQKQTSQNKT